VPQKRKPSRTAQSNTIAAAKPSESQDFLVLTAKIRVSVEATTNVSEYLTIWKKLESVLLLSTTAYEVLRENAQVYGHESPCNDEDVHFSSEEEIEDPFAKKKNKGKLKEETKRLAHNSTFGDIGDYVLILEKRGKIKQVNNADPEKGNRILKTHEWMMENAKKNKENGLMNGTIFYHP
ncbi:hypothetical protein NPIL_64081, partial [Nephila pilipes]